MLDFTRMLVACSVAMDTTKEYVVSKSVQVVASVEEAKREMEVKKEEELAKYVAKYPALFVGVVDKKGMDKAIWESKKLDYIASKEVTKSNINNESVSDMLTRIRAYNASKK